MNWLISSNPKMYDVVSAFNDLDTIDWRQSSSINVDDTVYIYCGKPIQKIMFRTKVLMTDISYENISRNDDIYYLNSSFSETSQDKKFMKLQLQQKYNSGYFCINNLLSNGLSTAPQGPMRINKNLSSYINNYPLQNKSSIPYKTLKDAVINAVKLLGGHGHRNEIYKTIKENNLYNFTTGKTPVDSISAVLQSNSQNSAYGTSDTFYSVYGISSRKGIWGLTNYKTDNSLFPETIDQNECFEGAKTTVTINRYERNTDARQICIDHHGCYCHVCEIDFEKVYGTVGHGFIHVHHIKPLHEINAAYIVDPINDLIPVCPNCHAMLHRKVNGKYLSIKELKAVNS